MSNGRRKVQTQLLMTKSARDRLDAIVVASGHVRAELLRQMVDAELPVLEARHAVQLARLDEVASSRGVTREELVEQMRKSGATVDR